MGVQGLNLPLQFSLLRQEHRNRLRELLWSEHRHADLILRLRQRRLWHERQHLNKRPRFHRSVPHLTRIAAVRCGTVPGNTTDVLRPSPAEINTPTISPTAGCQPSRLPHRLS